MSVASFEIKLNLPKDTGQIHEARLEYLSQGSLGNRIPKAGFTILSSNGPLEDSAKER